MAGRLLLILGVVLAGALYTTANVAGVVKRYDLSTEHDTYILVCDQEPLDVALIIDASSSIGSENFSLGIQFLQAFIGSYGIGPDNVRVAAVTFGRGVYNTFSFAKYKTKEQVQAALKALPYPAGLETRTWDGINHFVNKQIPNRRPKVPLLCIVLTDGNSQRKSATKAAAKRARDKGAKMFAIGVGDEKAIKEEELKNIAGADERIFRTSSYDTLLEEVTQKLLFQTCVKKPKPTTPPADQPCGIEFPTDIELIYDAASLGAEGNSRVTQFASRVLGAEGMEEGMQVGVYSALCPEDSGFLMGEYREPEAVKTRLDQLYDDKRLGYLAYHGIADGMSVEEGARPSSEASKVAVVFVGGKTNTNFLAEQIQAANDATEGGVKVLFADAGAPEGMVDHLANRFGTKALTGNVREQSDILHAELCG